MIQGTTKSGFRFEINENIGDNMELLEMLSDMKEGDWLAMSKVCEMTLGKEGKKALYDHLRTEDGRVPVADVSSAIVEIFEAAGKKGKNS